MHSANRWGGSFEITTTTSPGDQQTTTGDDLRRQQLDETQQSWLLGPPDPKKHRKENYIDLGCVMCKRKVFKMVLLTLVVVFFAVALPVIIVTSLPKHKDHPPPPDKYSVAIHKALMFFNAQKSGRLPKNNGVPWRGDSGLEDGSMLPDVKGGLVGGYYDAGDNIKFHFPMAFSMTLLSWSVIEYNHKYREIGEYDHVREIIKWGTDYLLLTFNSSASEIDHIYSQVGTAQNVSTSPDDHYCWTRAEDMDYQRPVQQISSGPDLAGEMAAALASASIVFRENRDYSKKLVNAATTLYNFARSMSRRVRYSRGNPATEFFYNSTGYFDEYMWAGAWLFYATGNTTYYLSFATNPSVPRNAHAFLGLADLRVFSWDNKLPAAQLLLTRTRMFLNPGYPYEDMLRVYHNTTGLNMCSYFKDFNVFNYTKGGLIQLNHGRPQNLQYVVNAVFLASLYADYMDADNIPGFVCGPNYFPVAKLRQFATSQMDYILGSNPKNMSYIVGYGTNYPRHIHHRGASIPHDGVKYSCTGGWKWRGTSKPNPNLLIGAMVGGPGKFDGFIDSTKNYSYTEPTLAGNAGLVAALISMTSGGNSGGGIDKNTMFSGVSPLLPKSPPPPSPWKP